MFFITTWLFERMLNPVWSFYQRDLSCCLFILHIPWCPRRARWSSFWAWFWAFATGIRVPVLMFFIATEVFELILRPVLSFYQCHLSCCVYVDCFTLVSYPCLFELNLSLVSSFPHWNLSCPMQNNIHKHTCALADVLSALHGYLSSFCAFVTVVWAVSFTCIDVKMSYTWSFSDGFWNLLGSRFCKRTGKPDLVC